MSAFRIEYLPKPGMEVKQFRQGFTSAETAEHYARTNMRTAVFANVTQGERIIKRLWVKEVCQCYLSDASPYRCLKVFDSKEELAAHVATTHTYRPRPSA